MAAAHEKGKQPLRPAYNDALESLGQGGPQGTGWFCFIALFFFFFWFFGLFYFSFRSVPVGCCSLSCTKGRPTADLESNGSKVMDKEFKTHPWISNRITRLATRCLVLMNVVCDWVLDRRLTPKPGTQSWETGIRGPGLTPEPGSVDPPLAFSVDG